jgi:peptidoglycan-N-acetylglucosamine deacetylase
MVIACSPSRPDATATSSPTGSRPVAITVDDLGYTAESSDPRISTQMLAHLRRFDAPVAVFVNCIALKDETLALWKAAGATIGNHTETHQSLDVSDVPGVSDRWWNGVLSCHDRLTRALGAPVRYFRYPYMHDGANETRKREAEALMASRGYRVAPVSAAIPDWKLDVDYRAALAAGDPAQAGEIARRYVRQLVESLAVANAAEERTTRPIALLHVNRLAADRLGEVLAALQADGWQFVSLERALDASR